ncbi:hypothetical protein [Micromonospora sp. C95]|uniref:hypothetical protein n=1 Tax=Micromonospora sp. C95 TaxID=2824882 RepID=UPI001B389644|nr:hypothetical protein [Micromonospora sp. C95]MBQ1027557.1 hypothetical protein [Micromonospora sp. C95]
MVPPRCHVCHHEPDQAPPGAVWFCGEHAPLGEERERLGSVTALRDIDAVLGRLPMANPAVAVQTGGKHLYRRCSPDR